MPCCLAVDAHQAGALNLAGFIRSTAGRTGTVADLSGGVAVAGPLAIAHGYVNAAVPTTPGTSPARFLDDAIEFFAGLDRAFVLWAPASDASFAAEAAARDLPAYDGATPAMVTHDRPVADVDLRFRVVDDEESAATFGDLCERSYEQPGMAWLMDHHESYDAPDAYWHLGLDRDGPVTGACGYLCGDVGGVYSVATPVEFRGRGYAAAVTATAANHLFDLGASRVVLQSSTLGFGVYQRLGFRVYDHYERFVVTP